MTFQAGTNAFAVGDNFTITLETTNSSATAAPATVKLVAVATDKFVADVDTFVVTSSDGSTTATYTVVVGAVAPNA